MPLLVTALHLRRLQREAWRSYAFCALSFGALGSLTGAIVLFVYGATMRYLADFIYGIVLLGVLGAFTCISALERPRWRTLAGVAVAGLCSATVVLGLLLAYQGYDEHFPRRNPELDQRLVQTLSVCPNPVLK